jgi:4-methylaminobutanoate oxidase (formaldehyde-forming)
VVDEEWLNRGSWAVDIAGERHAARVSLRPMYDPDMKKVRA